LGGSAEGTLLNCNERAQIFISESGLYSLIFGSEKVEAKPFKRWVTGVVLPTIRRTGAYSSEATPPPALPSDQQVWEAREARQRALGHACELSQRTGVT